MISENGQDGGLGGLKYPLLADFNKTISRDYGVLVESAGVALRYVVTVYRWFTIVNVTSKFDVLKLKYPSQRQS